MVQRSNGAVLVFDGDCGFCTSCAGWVARRWRTRADAVPWQRLGPGGLADYGLTVQQAQEAAWWVDETGRAYRGHAAMGQALRRTGGWTRVGGTAVLTPPFSWLAAGVYRAVVRYRHRLPGGTPACRAGGYPGGSERSTPIAKY